jgi:Spy/CpxP family protein refolding chaperone
MKIRTSILSLLALSSLLGSAVMAAPAGGSAPKPGMNFPRAGGGTMAAMIKELGITDAQKSKILGMMKGQMPKYRAIREDASLSDDQKRAKIKGIREANDKKIMTVLTPEQRKKFAAMIKERKNRMGRMRMDRKPA